MPITINKEINILSTNIEVPKIIFSFDNYEKNGYLISLSTRLVYHHKEYCMGALAGGADNNTSDPHMTSKKRARTTPISDYSSTYLQHSYS